MDSSIWVPPENQDESSYPTNGWEYNVYFDPRLDVIEQDALNEKSCKEVLKILRNEADSEIVDLEDDMLMVQRRLACEDRTDFAALNEKNVNLESMLTPSQNENQQTAEPNVGSSNLPDLRKGRETRSGVNNVDIASPESSIPPVPQVAPPRSSLSYIDNMSLVQLKALAYQHNIHGISKLRKTDLQQILRSKLQH